MRFLLFCFLFFSGFSSAEGVDYNLVSEAHSFRQGKTLIRYIQTYGKPCTYFQLIDSRDGWRVTDTQNFCGMDGKSFLTDFADAEVSNISVSERGVAMSLSVTPLEPIGEQKKECFMPVLNGAFGVIECRDVQ